MNAYDDSFYNDRRCDFTASVILPNSTFDVSDSAGEPLEEDALTVEGPTDCACLLCVGGAFHLSKRPIERGGSGSQVGELMSEIELDHDR